MPWPAYALVVLVIGGQAGCAGALAPFEVESGPAPAVRRALMERATLPPAARILPEAELVTYASGGGHGIRRDTIRGPDDIALWLQALRGRSAADARFELRPQEVSICDGAAVESGVYPVVTRDVTGATPRRVRRQRYVALWRPVGADWKLERLWLDPESRVRAASLATGCAASLRADRESRRFLVGVGARVGTAAEMGEVGAALEANGWVDPRASELAGLAPHAWLSYRVTPSWTLRPAYNGLGRSSAVGEYEDGSSAGRERLDVGGHAASLLAVRRLGPVWLGAGPAVALVRSEWAYMYWHERLGSTQRDRQESRVIPGLAAELSTRITTVPTVVPHVTLGYSHYADIQPHSSRWAAPASVRLRGLALTLGLEWAP